MNPPSPAAQNERAGVTLLEVMIVVAVFATMMWAVFITLDNAATMKETGTRELAMQSSSRQMLDEISTRLKEAQLSAHEVDTRMRWLFDDEYEAYDKFHTWAYVRDDGGAFQPAMLQCPETECGWAVQSGIRIPRFTKFVSNYHYIDGTPDHFEDFYDGSASPQPGKGFSYAGRVYNDLFDSNRHTENGLNPYLSGYSPTTARCVKGNGARLSPLVQLDVLQFPTPRNIKDQYITNERPGMSPDKQGWLIYAPYYNAGTETLQLRRYSIFVTDFFKTFPWNGNSNPLYDPAVEETETMDPDVVDVADSVFTDFTGEYEEDMTSYNKVIEGGSNLPPDWDNNKPDLKDMFDFNGNNLIETDLDSDGNGKITYGTTRAETESIVEQFRLYPSTSTVEPSPSDRFNDWPSDSDINDVRGLIYHKFHFQNMKGNYDYMEIYYFIDLKTGWTRFYFFAHWDGSKKYHINASYIRQPFGGMDPTFKSDFYIPYKVMGRGIIGLDFSTHFTYPDDVKTGIELDENAVRIGVIMDRKQFHKGNIQFPSHRLETKISLNP